MNQRWNGGRDSYRPRGEVILPREYDVQPINLDSPAKEFVRAHHYEHSYPAAVIRHDLHRRGRPPPRQPQVRLGPAPACGAGDPQAFRLPQETRGRTVTELKRLLDALGDDSAAVARSLQDRRIRGTLLEPHLCPVARYLQREGWETVSVNTDWIEACHNGIEVSVATPDAVASFVCDFDRGLYPSLKTHGNRHLEEEETP
jgi:hypothetical protein